MAARELVEAPATPATAVRRPDSLARPLGGTAVAFDRPVARRVPAPLRFEISAVLLAVTVGFVLLLPRRVGRHPGQQDERA